MICANQRRAFTLVELLVVIAIITVLTAILIPALNAAREQGKRIVCFSNLRSLACSWISYADENDDKLVSAHTSSFVPNAWVTGDYRDVEGGPGKTMDLRGGVRNVEGNLSLIQGKLYPYTDKRLALYKCPADVRGSPAPRSYSINDYVNGNGRYFSKGPVKKLTNMQFMEDVLVFIEDGDIPWSNGPYYCYPWGHPNRENYWADQIGVFHRDKACMSFADGHAEVIQWFLQETIDICSTDVYAWSQISPYQVTDTTDLRSIQKKLGSRY
jgi:prepilin-type N-terminal cleavage/methylation domain-containing protein